MRGREDLPLTQDPGSPDEPGAEPPALAERPVTRDGPPLEPAAATPELAGLLEPELLDGPARDAELMRRLVRQRLFGGPEPAYRVDRFIVLERVGHGGMGLVYEAYDPQLERKLALKVVRPTSSAGDAAARDRMLREARALARLSHPNVVPVYEVGEHEDEVFIAMELVRGETLGDYAQAPGRSMQELVDAYVQAGRGLAAAHAVGLVHRDFKPSNAIVGEDGRVRVLDFGLARDAGASTPAAFRWTPEPIPSSAQSLTPIGAVVGTPAYMAPEQRFGDPVTPASDQYSLCASLHEALTGVLPVVSVGHEEVRLGSFPREARRLRPILARGLALAANDRWPSMDALCTALERANHPRRILLRGALVIGLVGGLGLAASMPRQSPCTTDEAALAGVWDEPRREAVQAQLLGTGVDFASELAHDATQALDRYAEGWSTVQTEACIDHHVDHVTSAELFDRTMACLERRRARLTALVDRLHVLDARAAPRVLDALRSLPPLEPCRDREALLAALPPPEEPSVVEQVTAIRERLDASLTTERLGNLDEALTLAEEAVRLAQALDYRPIQAEAAYALGKVHLTRRELDEAQAQLDEAVWLAEAGRHDELVVDGSSQLVVTRAMRGELDAARAQARRTEAAIERLGRRTRGEVELESGLGNVARLEGKLEEARDHYARAHELAEELELDPANIGEHLDNLASMHSALGGHEHALELWQQAYALKRSGLGELHPSVLRTRLHIGTVYFQNGRLDDAATAIQAVLDDAARSKLESGELLAASHTNLAAIHGTAGRHAEARVHAERSVAAYREALGSDHPQLIPALITLGASQARTGQRGLARTSFEEAVALGRATKGDDAYLASVLINLAILDLDDGDAATSLRHADEAVKMLEATVGERHADLSRGHLARGRALRALGDLAGATEAARRGLATIPESGPASDRAEGFASMGLAERLAEQGKLAEARELALRALAAHERLGDEEEVATVRAWLEQHGAG